MKRLEFSSASSIPLLAVVAALLGGCPGGQIFTYNQDVEVVRDRVDLQDRDYVAPPDVVPEDSTFTGIVKDYFTGAPVAGATLSTVGITPPVTGAGDGTGTFSLTIPVGSVFWVEAYAPGYAYTNDYVDISNPVPQHNQNIYAVPQTEIDTLATAFGKTQVEGCGVVMTTAKNGGNAQSNVEVSLGGLDYEGPYYLDPQDAGDPAATYTSTSGRAIFFNVCDIGLQTLTDGAVALLSTTGDYSGAPRTATVYSGGVTLVNLLVEDGGVVEPPPVDVIDFPTEVFPVFQKFACAGCHDQNANAAYDVGLRFNAEPEALFYELTNRPQVVNIAVPADSYLLTKPLYEDPPNHPNASFIDVYDEDYLQVLQWIEAGAPYGAAPPPDPNVNPDFATDVFPIFTTRNCIGCHNAADQDGGLNLQVAPDVAQTYIEANLMDIAAPNYSSLLNNPYCGPNGKCDADANRNFETHPTEVFVTDLDPDYVTIERWLEYRADQLANPDYEYQANVVFEDQIYRFAALECTRCHSQQGASGGLVLEGTPYQIYQSLTDIAQNPQAVVPNQPEQSSLYVKPNAFYADVNHSGGKPVLDRLDNYAKYFGGWLNEGAAAPLDVDPTWEETKLVFGAGALNCLGCHNAANASGGLSLDDDPADPAVLYDTVRALVNDQYYIQDSAIVYKPFSGNQYLYVDQAHGGPKRNIAQYYNEYTLLQSWIAAGAPGPQ